MRLFLRSYEKRTKNGFLVTQSSRQSFDDCGVSASTDAGPIHGASFFSINFYPFGTAGISGLLHRSSPNAIFRAIWTIAILAFKSVPKRTISHVQNEQFIRIAPSQANFYRDSLSSIQVPVLKGWRVAPTNHHVPSIIKRLFLPLFGRSKPPAFQASNSSLLGVAQSVWVKSAWHMFTITPNMCGINNG